MCSAKVLGLKENGHWESGAALLSPFTWRARGEGEIVDPSPQVGTLIMEPGWVGL